MLGMNNVIVINAEQAIIINNYNKNTKGKLLKSEAAVWFNKMYRFTKKP